jgi:hypothetical protein
VSSASSGNWTHIVTEKTIFCKHYSNCRLLLSTVLLTLYLTLSIYSSFTIVLIDYDFRCCTFLDILTVSISYTPLDCGIKNIKEQLLNVYLHILDLLLQSQVVLRSHLGCLPDITSKPWTEAKVTYTSPDVSVG